MNDNDDDFLGPESGFEQRYISDLILSREEEDLLYSDRSGIRMFRPSGSKVTLVGVLLAETEDSFLVALPGLPIESEDGTLSVEPALPPNISYTRVFKASLFMVVPPSPSVKKLYEKYLQEVAPREYPELLNILNIEPEKLDENSAERKIEEALLNGAYFSGNDSKH